MLILKVSATPQVNIEHPGEGSMYIQFHTAYSSVLGNFLSKSFINDIRTSTMQDCSGLNSVSRVVFSHLMPKIDFYYRFSWGKIHYNDSSHAMVISIITSPSPIGKNWPKNGENYPP